jgi:hypothetical protein
VLSNIEIAVLEKPIKNLEGVALETSVAVLKAV